MWRFLILASLAFTLACGGAEIGESCDESGSKDECVDGAICTDQAGKNICYKICTDQTDCGATEDCNGISGSSTKSCQPKP